MQPIMVSQACALTSSAVEATGMLAPGHGDLCGAARLLLVLKVWSLSNASISWRAGWKRVSGTCPAEAVTL